MQFKETCHTKSHIDVTSSCIFIEGEITHKIFVSVLQGDVLDVILNLREALTSKRKNIQF